MSRISSNSLLAKRQSIQPRSGYRTLLLVIVVAVGMRTMGLVTKHHWTHDECVSYIAATGHQSEYLRMIQSESPPYGVWTRCREWKYFIEPTEKFCFSTIRKDLIESDVHPPLFFWMLHLFCLLFGVTLWTGVLLNIFLLCIGAIIFWKMVLWVGLDRRTALLSLALWMWSPAAVQASLEARPYELFTLAGIFFVWQLLKVTHSNNISISDVGTLIIAILMGIFSHYHFYLFLFSAFVSVGYLACRERQQHILWVALAILTAAIITNLLHRGVFTAIPKLREELLFTDSVIRRLDRIVLALSSFLSHVHLIQYLLIALGFIFLIRFMIFNKNLFDFYRHLPSGMVVLNITVIVFITLVSFLYILGFSPKHAMGGKYLLPIWPLAVVIFVSMISAKNHFSKWQWIIPAFLFIQTFIDVKWLMVQEKKYSDPQAIFRKADAIIIDNVARGELLRLIWYIPEDKDMLAAGQEALLKRTDWQGKITCRTCYLSKRSYGNTAIGQTEILRRWPANCTPVLVPGANSGLGELFITSDGNE